MNTTPAQSLRLLCTAVASGLMLVSAATAADLAVRVIDRSPDVRNLDTTDTLKWYADESIDYTVRPRRGKAPVDIPADATATWTVADAATGTNYLSALAISLSSNSVAFHLPAGGAALPADVDEWVSFVTLFQGTNFLGVIDRTRVECLWAPAPSEAEIVRPTSDLPAIFEAVRELIDGRYIAMVDGQWTVIRLPQAQALYLDGEEVLSARQEVESTARILGVKAAGNALEIRFLGAETNRLESCRDAETWDVVPDCTWGTDGGTGTVSVAAADSGSWYRIVAGGDVPGRTNTWLQAALPLYLGTKAATNRVATRGDVSASEDSILALLAAEYLTVEGNEPSPPGPVPQDPVLAWSITPTGSTFNAITMGGERRETWPSFETGGPLFPCFVQVAGAQTNTDVQYIPTGEARPLGAIEAVPLVREKANMLNLSQAAWTNERITIEGAVPHYVDTDTMVWSAGEPTGFGTSRATGFWWRVAGPVTGEWACAIGIYTGHVALAKTVTETTNLWGFSGDTPGSLRERANADLEALKVPGKSVHFFSALSVTGTVRNPDYWAAPVDITCVSPLIDITNRAILPDQYGAYGHHTAITRRHVLGANHWHLPPGGGRLCFVDNANNIYERGLVRGARIGSTDLWVGELDEELPAAIRPACIIHSNDWGRLLARKPADKPWAVQSRTGSRDARLEAVHVRYMNSRSMWFDVEGIASPNEVLTVTNSGRYHTGDRYTGETAPFIGGDSSSPVLLWLDGQTCLVETLHLGSGHGPNVSWLAPQIEAQIRSWGGTETNLYWADLEDWPDYPAESEEE